MGFHLTGNAEALLKILCLPLNGGHEPEVVQHSWTEGRGNVPNRDDGRVNQVGHFSRTLVQSRLMGFQTLFEPHRFQH